MEISCTITKQMFIDYYLFMQKKLINIFRIFGIIFLIFAPAITFMTVTEYTDKQELIQDLDVIIPVFVIFVALGIYMVFGYKPLAKKVAQKLYYSNKYLCNDPVITLQFNENNFKVLTTSKLGIEDCTYSYELINQVVETNTALYIMMSSNQAHIVDKTKDTEAINKISDYLKSKLGIKYVTQLSKK